MAGLRWGWVKPLAFAAVLTLVAGKTALRRRPNDYRADLRVRQQANSGTAANEIPPSQKTATTALDAWQSCDVGVNRNDHRHRHRVAALPAGAAGKSSYSTPPPRCSAIERRFTFLNSFGAGIRRRISRRPESAGQHLAVRQRPPQDGQSQSSSQQGAAEPSGMGQASSRRSRRCVKRGSGQRSADGLLESATISTRARKQPDQYSNPQRRQRTARPSLPLRPPEHLGRAKSLRTVGEGNRASHLSTVPVFTAPPFTPPIAKSAGVSASAAGFSPNRSTGSRRSIATAATTPAYRP